MPDVAWAQHVEAHAPPPPPPTAHRAARAVGSQVPSAQWFVVDNVDCLPDTAGVWFFNLSRPDKISKRDFVSARIPMFNQFLQKASGNSDWPCPLCSRSVTIDHVLHIKHIGYVWHALDEANGLLNMTKGTYMDRAYGVYGL